jgi:hypothetical protein
VLAGSTEIGNAPAPPGRLGAMITPSDVLLPPAYWCQSDQSSGHSQTTASDRFKMIMNGFANCPTGENLCDRLCKRQHVAPIARNVEIRHRMSQG